MSTGTAKKNRAGCATRAGMQLAWPNPPHTSEDKPNDAQSVCARPHSYSVSSQRTHGETLSILYVVLAVVPFSEPKTDWDSRAEFLCKNDDIFSVFFF